MSLERLRGEKETDKTMAFVGAKREEGKEREREEW